MRARSSSALAVKRSLKGVRMDVKSKEKKGWTWTQVGYDLVRAAVNVYVTPVEARNHLIRHVTQNSPAKSSA
jgi:hypothetical protein